MTAFPLRLALALLVAMVAVHYVVAWFSVAAQRLEQPFAESGK
ncbi:MAG: hypothetical protein ACRCYS_18650 [Beijerinckiaceae bacterium]